MAKQNLITKSAAADLIGVSRQYINKLVIAGSIKQYAQDGKTLVDKMEILKFGEQRKKNLENKLRNLVDKF